MFWHYFYAELIKKSIIRFLTITHLWYRKQRAWFAILIKTCLGKKIVLISTNFDIYYMIWEMKLQPPPPPFSKIKKSKLTWLIFNCKNNFLYFSDWWAFAQAASCFGFFGILVSFFLVILYLFVDSCKGNGEVATGAAILCLVTGKNLMAMTTWSMVILTLPSHPLPASLPFVVLPILNLTNVCLFVSCFKFMFAYNSSHNLV